MASFLYFDSSQLYALPNSFRPNHIIFGFDYRQQQGEYLQEVGQIQPSLLTGQAGGSRLTYDRAMPLYGPRIELHYDRVEIEWAFRTTGWRRRSPNNFRDEDFWLDMRSQRQSSKISLKEGHFYDSPTVFSGVSHFADAYATSHVTHYESDLSVRYLTDWPIHFIVGASYGYSDYYVTDALQWVRPPMRPLSEILPGHVLTLTNASLEGLWGLGYRQSWAEESWHLELELLGTVGRVSARDRHVLRHLNFLIETGGTGFRYNLALSRQLNSQLSLRVSAYGNRLYTRGGARARGGTQQHELLSGLMGSFNIWMNRKEAGSEISLDYRLPLR